MAPTTIYIAGFRQHAGKTVTSLGLIYLLSRYMDPRRIGYIKPVGQELSLLPDGSSVDKDALVIEKFSGIPELDMASVSPVRLGSGFTKQYLKETDPEAATLALHNNIERAMESFKDKDIVIAEGTGHPGVGGIVGLSNARVAHILKSPMIYLSGGGIGKALDMLEVDLTYFAYCQTDLRGIIFNKLIPDKIDTVKDYITEDLLQKKYNQFPKPLEIFGFLPEVPDLSKPSMRIIQKKFRECRTFGNTKDKRWENPCRRVRIISLSDDQLHLTDHIDDGDLVMLAGSSRRRLKRILEFNKTHDPITLGGLVLTLGNIADIEPDVAKEIEKSGIPTILVKEGTADAESKIHNIFANTKLQVYDAHKHREIEELFANHFDIVKLIKNLGLKLDRK